MDVEGPADPRKNLTAPGDPDLVTSGTRWPWDAIRSNLARWLVRGTVGLAVLTLLLWIVAARGTGMGTLVPWALQRAVPDGWTVDVVEVEGDWRSAVTLRQVSLVGPATSVYADRVRSHSWSRETPAHGAPYCAELP